MLRSCRPRSSGRRSSPLSSAVATRWSASVRGSQRRSSRHEPSCHGPSLLTTPEIRDAGQTPARRRGGRVLTYLLLGGLGAIAAVALFRSRQESSPPREPRHVVLGPSAMTVAPSIQPSKPVTPATPAVVSESPAPTPRPLKVAARRVPTPTKRPPAMPATGLILDRARDSLRAGDLGRRRARCGGCPPGGKFRSKVGRSLHPRKGAPLPGPEEGGAPVNSPRPSSSIPTTSLPPTSSPRFGVEAHHERTTGGGQPGASPRATRCGRRRWRGRISSLCAENTR